MECNDDQFDDNVEDMIRDVKGEEDEMTKVELRKYRQLIEDSKKTTLSPL